MLKSSNEHYDIELLADYLEGLLSEAAAQKINDHLASCERCEGVKAGIQNHFDEHGYDRELLMTAMAKGKVNVADFFFNGEENTHPQDSPTNDRPKTPIKITAWYRSTWFRVAASLVILSLAGWLWVSLQPSPQKYITQSLADPFVTFPTMRSQSNVDKVQQLAQDFNTLYNKKEYEQAGSKLDSIFALGVRDPYDYFYAGLCDLYRSEPDLKSAISNLDTASTWHADHWNRKAAAWYLGLAYYLDNQQGKAKLQLQQIINEAAHPYHKEAETLLDLINKEEA